MAERLTPDQVKLVLRRAAELERRTDGDDEHFSPAQIEEIAREVGISSPAVRRALAEVDRPAQKPTLADRIIGPSEIVLERDVPLAPAAARARIAEFMAQQVMRIRRDLGDRVVWERTRGLIAAAQVMATSLGYGGVVIPKRAELETSVAEISPTESRVRIVLRLPEQRARRVRSATVGAGFGAIVVVGAIAAHVHPLGAEVVTIGAGSLLGTGAVMREHRKYARETQRVTDGLERFLDLLR